METTSLFAYSTVTTLNVVLNVTLGVFSDDDSEPILGLWFEETISPSKEKVAPPPPPPPPPLETSPRLKSPSKLNTAENGNILASRKDPELVRPMWSADLVLTNFATGTEMLVYVLYKHICHMASW